MIDEFKMMLTDNARLKHALWMLMERDIHRYLLVNSEGRLDGSEKASRHLNLSYTYVASRTGVSVDEARTLMRKDCISMDSLVYEKIHRETRELTDFMDEKIDFPMQGRPDYDTLAPKFFNEFLWLADRAWFKYRLWECE